MNPGLSYRFANLESSRFPPTGGKQTKKQCAHLRAPSWRQPPPRGASRAPGRALLARAPAERGAPARPPRPALPPAPPMNAPEKIRCDACPVMCYIAPGQTGACDRYGNLGGRIVRSDPLTVLDRTLAAGGAVVPFSTGDWDGEIARDGFVTGIGAGTTYPDYKPAPFIVASEVAGRRRRHRRHRGDLQLLRRQGEDRHRPPPRPRAGRRARRRRGDRPRHHRRIRLADAFPRRRRAPDRRLQGRGPRHLRRTPRALQPRAGRARGRRRLLARRPGRPPADRRRRSRAADARRLRFGHHRHVRRAMARPRRRGRRRRRPHHRRRLRAPGRQGAGLGADRHPHQGLPLDPRPLLPRLRARRRLGRHQHLRSARDPRPLRGAARRPPRHDRADGLDHRRGARLLRARRPPRAGAPPAARERCARPSR